jgi:hypothetical protein
MHLIAKVSPRVLLPMSPIPELQNHNFHFIPLFYSQQFLINHLIFHYLIQKYLRPKSTTFRDPLFSVFATALCQSSIETEKSVSYFPHASTVPTFPCIIIVIISKTYTFRSRLPTAEPQPDPRLLTARLRDRSTLFRFISHEAQHFARRDMYSDRGAHMNPRRHHHCTVQRHADARERDAKVLMCGKSVITRDDALRQTDHDEGIEVRPGSDRIGSH